MLADALFGARLEARGAESQDSNRPKQLQVIVDVAVQKALEKFTDKKLQPDQLAVTVIDLHDASRPSQLRWRNGITSGTP